MIKTELEAVIVERKLGEKVKEIAKVSSKPTNAEYVTVLEMYDAENASKVVAPVEECQAPVDDPTHTPIDDKETVKQTMADDYSTMVPVIVTDHDNTVTIAEDEARRVVEIRWGNPMIGMSTTTVAMHGRMQYLPKGAIIRLKKITLADHIKNEDGKEQSTNDRNRFSVSDTTGWTDTEFEAHAKEQALKRI